MGIAAAGRPGDPVGGMPAEQGQRPSFVRRVAERSAGSSGSSSPLARLLPPLCLASTKRDLAQLERSFPSYEYGASKEAGLSGEIHGRVNLSRSLGAREMIARSRWRPCH